VEVEATRINVRYILNENLIRGYVRKILREEYEYRKTFRQYRKISQVRTVR